MAVGIQMSLKSHARTMTTKRERERKFILVYVLLQVCIGERQINLQIQYFDSENLPDFNPACKSKRTNNSKPGPHCALFHKPQALYVCISPWRLLSHRTPPALFFNPDKHAGIHRSLIL
jgi:hypothetical protein